MRILLPILFLMLVSCGGGDSASSSRHKSPQGVTVIGNIEPRDLVTIDQAIDGMNVMFTANGYRGMPNHSEYVIEVIPGNFQCDVYSFVVEGYCQVRPDNNTCYDGSIYDLNPKQGEFKICVAGQYDPVTDKIKTTLRAIRETEIIRYEAEHFALRRVDEKKYEETLFHTVENPHPIIK